MQNKKRYKKNDRKNILTNDKKILYDIIAIVVSIVALVFSVFAHRESMNVEKSNTKMQEKYEKLGTYEMTLNYQLDISDKYEKGVLIFDDKEIETNTINIIPKTGGVERVYVVHHYQKNVKAINQVELYFMGMENEYDSQESFYMISEYVVDNVAQTDNKYFGTMFLVIKDYSGNYYTNMIVFEIDKNNMSDIQTRIYDEVDLLYYYNNQINVLPEFDINQMGDYYDLKNKLDTIL